MGSSSDGQFIGPPTETGFFLASRPTTDYPTSPTIQNFIQFPNVLSPPTTPIKLAPESGHFRSELSDFRSKFNHFEPQQSNINHTRTSEPKSSQHRSTVLSKNALPNPKVQIKEFKISEYDELSRSSRDSSSPISMSNDPVEEPAIEYLNTNDCHKRFGCPYTDCDYKSNRKNNLQRHKETMHSARAVAFSCCMSRFYRRADFDRHKAEEHSQGYACPKCDKHFERRATLARHERSHDKDTPFW
jgi:hypothetical protein